MRRSRNYACKPRSGTCQRRTARHVQVPCVHCIMHPASREPARCRFSRGLPFFLGLSMPAVHTVPCALLCCPVLSSGVHVHVHSHAHVNVNIHPSGPAGANRIESCRRGRGIWRRAYRLGGAEPSIGWCSATASTIEPSIPWPFRSFFRQKFCLRRRRPACTSRRPQKC